MNQKADVCHREPGDFADFFVAEIALELEIDHFALVPGQLFHQPENFADGLPLLLHLKEPKEPAWELALDLAELNEEAWEELQRHPADLVTASNASTTISQKQFMYAHCLLRVYPFLQP